MQAPGRNGSAAAPDDASPAQPAASPAAPSPRRFFEAARRADWDAVTTMVDDGMNINIADPLGRTAIFFAAIGRDSESIQALIQKGADPGKALLVACSRGDWGVAHDLLEHGARPNCYGPDARTPLHLVAGAPASSLILLPPRSHAVTKRHDWYFLYTKASLVERLIRKGADVNSRDSEGHTPLFWAVLRDDEPTNEQLLEHGAED